MDVKICGIKTKEAAITAYEAGADFLGFVFAESKRKITSEEAAHIGEVIPSSIKKVGVFVNETKETIEAIAEKAGLDYIQLHGNESPEFCRQFQLPVIKAFSIKDSVDVEKLSDYECDFYLVDSPGVQYAGGSGMPFDWSLLQNLPIPKEKLILAGGLSAKNVQEAIKQVQPVAIDVSSGVETNGEKDHQKIKEFIRKAQATV